MKRMLFNATQAEELRVAIVDGQKLIDLDIESASKEQRKSNIYKAVITRLEPSLEAAFVEYGAERHGFLPFKEISRSYFKPGVDVGKARIQDALSVGQELIVQVEKDERGNKGAALTTYISLAGRYLVLMPNNPRGGGVSRRIEGEDRQELREIMDQLEVPSGTSLIARTAGIGRSLEELQWDLNYLLQLWNAIDGAAKAQSGVFLIYQESSLVIRAIRDYFHSEIGEILIDTDDVFEQAQQFMSHVMPGNVSRVKRYQDDVPLFSRFQIEHQIESAYSRQVTLPSGGAIVIDHTEALVSVDVNSGRSTKGSDIEETALRTNCEAADEIARQLRLRDLGGLIVIDFIDMEAAKNQREVENRLRDALHHDRARVQTGKISRFGLLELSRQRLRPALAETSYITCPRCTGTGHIRSTESAALHILRILEEESMKDNTGALHCQVPVDVGTFLLNEKRVDISHIESRHRVNLVIVPNRHLETPAHEIVRVRHDQLNSEGPSNLASYQMATRPLEEAYQTPSAQAEVKPVKIEAAVRGVPAGQPAPIVESSRPAKAATPSISLFSKIAAFFFGEKKVATPAPKSEDANAQRSRNNNRNRNRDGNRDRTSRAEGQPANGERKTRPQGQQGSQSRRDEAPPAQDVSNNRNKPAAPKEAKEAREPREPREPRQPRPPRSTPSESPADITVSPAPTFTEAEASTAEGTARSGRRNRGRGRGRNDRADRGDRTEDGLAPAIDNNNTASIGFAETSNITAETNITPTQTFAPATVIAAAPAAPRLAAAQLIPAPPAPIAPVIEVSATPIPASVPAASTVSEAPPFALPETMHSAIPSAAASVMPVVAPPPVAHTPTPPKDFSDTLQQAGLILIQTAQTAKAPSALVVPTQPLGRKPKPAQIIADEPLQMIETKPD
ncbi:MAG: Rne/Rng family ribonuclease [Rugosibacter sp.]|jgi:ribonuclease E|nr:Rne/Rng family ribonuclease [Rugosibacter sp.]